MKKSALAVLLAAACTATAGIRIIHGGGGYAEMAALSVLQRLAMIVQPCLRNPRVCALSEIETALLQKAWQSGVFSSASKARLDYFQRGTGDVYIPSADLYDSGGAPKPAAEIGAAVFTAWLTRDPNTAANDVQAIARKIFASASLQTESLDMADVRLHSLTIKRPVETESEVLVLAENAERTADITSSVLSQLPCAPTFERRMVQLTGLHAENRLIVGRALWLCGEMVYSGRMILSLNASDLKPGVRLKSVAPVACAKELGGR